MILLGGELIRNIFGHRKTNDISFPVKNSILFKLAVGFEAPDLPVNVVNTLGVCWARPFFKSLKRQFESFHSYTQTAVQIIPLINSCKTTQAIRVKSSFLIENVHITKHSETVIFKKSMQTHVQLSMLSCTS